MEWIVAFVLQTYRERGMGFAGLALSEEYETRQSSMALLQKIQHGFLC